MLPDAHGKKGRASHVSPINIYSTHEADFLIGVGKGGIFCPREGQAGLSGRKRMNSCVCPMCVVLPGGLEIR